MRGAREFARLKEQGQRRICGCLILNWRTLEGGDGRSRVGVVTSRRLGGAVVRNRARRLIREAFRLNQHRLRVPLQLILVARASIVGRALNGVVRDLRRGLSEVGLWSEPPPATTVGESAPGPGPAQPTMTPPCA